jgi:hypothetical protein
MRHNLPTLRRDSRYAASPSLPPLLPLPISCLHLSILLPAFPLDTLLPCRALPSSPHISSQFLASNLRETSRKDLHECHSYGQWALQQIKKQHRLHSQHSNSSGNGNGNGQYGGSNSIHSQYTLSNEVIYGDSQHPPIDFYSNAIERLEGRLEKSIHEIQEVSL